jgi:chromosome segregation ATPase
MTQSSDHEARIARLEVRIEEVAADARVARHLAAANDRDYSDLAVKVDAHRRAINALGERTRAGFDRVDERFDRVDERFAQVDERFDRLEGRFTGLEDRVDGLETEMRAGFAAMRHGFDQTAAGFARIAELIDSQDDDR